MSMKPSSPPVRGSSRRLQGGASLIEVLIAVLILAIGMLGMAALQSISLKNSASSSSRSAAVIQTYSLLDVLRLNRDAALNGTYNVTSYTCTPSTAASGSTSDFSVFNTWLAQTQAALGDPNACGMINCESEPGFAGGLARCRVGVRWDDSRALGLSTGGAAVNDAQRNFEVVTRL